MSTVHSPAPSVQSSGFADDLLSAVYSPLSPALPAPPVTPDPDDAGPYIAPCRPDEAWYEGLCAGLNAEMPDPPAGYDAACADLYRRAWESGYRERIEEFEAWLDAFERSRDMDDPDYWNEATGCLAGHPAFED
jgi:hypothetical protein